MKAQVNFSCSVAELDSFTNRYYPSSAGADTIDKMLSYVFRNGTSPLTLNWQVITHETDRPDHRIFLGVADSMAVRFDYDSLEQGKVFKTAGIAPPETRA